MSEEAALAYLTRSWSAMAVPERSKERLRPWKHLQSRLPTPEEVHRDFGQERGAPNVAIIIGLVSGLVVLDADTPEAVDRLAALSLPPTLTVKTARGRHWYFRTTRTIPSRKVDGLELRGERSYVLAPPSVHPWGLVYRFEDPDAPLAELPERVLGLFGDATAGAPSQAPPELPDRWLRLVERNHRTRAAWEGRGEHQDRSGSGKDLFLAHEARRCGFGPAEARQIVLAAPWSVQGGRTATYLDRTIGRAYQAGQKRPLPIFGMFPASLIDNGIFAGLTSPEKALLVVLCVRRMRRSSTVLRSVDLLARDAGMEARQLRRAAAKLETRGLIRRHRVAGGRTLYHLPCFLPDTTVPVREAETAAEPASDLAETTASRSDGPEMSGKKRRLSGLHSTGKPSLVMNGSTPPAPDPSAPGISEALKAAEGDPAPPLPSMRLDQELDGRGNKKVFRICSDGRRVLVWLGTIDEWLPWIPPECLRYEERMAEWPKPASAPSPRPDRPAPLALDRTRRCEAVTRAGLACALHPLVGSPYCRGHERQRQEAPCVSEA